MHILHISGVLHPCFREHLVLGLSSLMLTLCFPKAILMSELRSGLTLMTDIFSLLS